MSNQRVRSFLKQHRMDIVLSLIALLMIGAIVTVLFYAVPLCRTLFERGASLVTPVVYRQSTSDSQEEMSYRELSASYAQLAATGTPWTELTPEQVTAGNKGGLYFISREDLEFSIYHVDGNQLCDGQFTFADFDHIWMNSEHDRFYVVVNVAGKQIDLSDYYILARDDSALYASRVLINCYEAESVDLSGSILTGTLLAPDATVTCANTYMYGQILAKEIRGAFLAHKELPFTGYQSIMDGLSVVPFQNEGVRLAALQFLQQHNADGRYDGYTQDSQILKRDLQAITALEIQNCDLVELEQDLAKFKNLTSLKVHNTNLQTLSLIGQSGLLELEVTDAPLRELDLTDVPQLQRLLVDRTQLTQLALSQVPNLTVLSYSGTPLGWLDYTPLPRLQYLDCSDSGIQDAVITGETLPALTTLRIEKNGALTGIDVQSFKALERLDCASCALTEIDLEHFTKLRYLRCSYNRIAVLDFSHFTQLYSVECYGDSLQSMIVTNWADAAYADCEITRVYQ